MVNLSITKLNKQKLFNSLSVLILLAGMLEPFIFPVKTDATATTGFFRPDRMVVSLNDSGGVICLTPQTTGTEGKVVVTFPGNGTQGSASYGVDTTVGHWTTDTTATNLPQGVTGWPSIGANATSVSGAAVTIASGDLTVNTQYCFHFTTSGANGLQTPTGANSSLTGTIQTQTAGGAAIDTVNFATASLSNDQIAVTATVPSTFSFSLGSNTAAIGTINTTGATSATAITATVSTNANNGWIAWAKSANAALNSASTGDTIPSAAYVNNNSSNIVNLSSAAGYVLDVQTGTNSPTIATSYAGNGSTSGGNFDTHFEQLASQTAPASGSTFTMAVRARASATNKAATDYSDTVTVNAAGQF